MRKDLAVPTKLAKSCAEDLMQNKGIQSREDFLAAWRSGTLGRQWFRDMDTIGALADEDIDEFEAKVQALVVSWDKKDRVLSCLRGQVWTEPPVALRDALGSDPYAELGRINSNLPPAFDGYDVLSLDSTLLLNRIGDGLRTKLNMAMYPFAKVAFDAAQDPTSGSFAKVSKFAPLSYLGEGGFAVCLSVRDTETSVKYAMVGSLLVHTKRDIYFSRLTENSVF
jgi:hypothetical protein